MIINHNIAALNTYRQLSSNNMITQKSLEKLSSGMRINRAGDDAAGLAISEKMRAQIRGLDQAARNAQDSISLIQTAEGALNEVHSILQRMRELANQAANDTNTEVDRGEIQKEINQLTSEINRIGNTTEFNTMKLLNGERAIVTTTETIDAVTQDVTTIKDGPGGNVSVTTSLGVTISDTQEAWKNAIANGIVIGEDAEADEAIDWTNINLSETARITIEKTAEGNLSVKLEATDNIGNAYVHEAIFNADTMQAAATNGVYNVEFHGVSFDLDLAAFDDVGTGESVILDLTAAVDNNLTDVTGTYGLNHDFTDPAEGAKFNYFTIDGSNAALVGMETIEISFDGTDVIVTGYDADGNVVLNDTTTLDTPPATAGDKFVYDENGISFEFELIADTDGNDITSFTTNKLNVKDLVAQKVTEEQVITPAQTKTKVVSDNSLKMQIGANTGQSMAVDISDMRSLALGISSDVANDTVDVVDSMGNTVTAKFTAISNVTNGTDNNNVEYALDVSTHATATAAVKVINNAIEKVSAERSKLGAFQNRLEHTINNLGTSAENLTAAESRIRDVDMAKEMMEFTKMSILAQAAQAMLAQANQMPQGVLQLLR